ncbi:hypothetical protein Tco_0860543 [Tanacetum coccineum]|uniref:Uncharacterized protein n=1 Tax=Tanacetum coccineum TaxID=301880 RepID=A0ABQ5BIN3_9ASTR
MTCSLPHTVEEIKEYVQKQCDIDDAARQQAIIAVTKLFNEAYHAKQALKEQYVECKDIPQERRVVIEKILYDESMKDLEVEHKIMPPRRLKRIDVERLVSSWVAEAIAEYKRNRTNPENVGGSSRALPGGMGNVTHWDLLMPTKSPRAM